MPTMAKRLTNMKPGIQIQPWTVWYNNFKIIVLLIFQSILTF